MATSRLWRTAFVAFSAPSKVIIVAFRTIPVTGHSVVRAFIAIKARSLFATLETSIVVLSTAVTSWFSASIAFLSESKIVVIAFRAIPVATVGPLISVWASTSIIAFEAPTAVISVKSTTAVVSPTILTIVSSSVAKVSFFSGFFGSDIYFNTNKSRDVEFSVQVCYVCERGVGVPKHCVDLTDVIPSLEIHNNGFQCWR